jgi:hypothetical protein
MKPMSMEYNAVSTAVADDYEDDGVFQATPISIKMKKVGHSLFGCCCDTRRGTIIVDIIMIVASSISLAMESLVLYGLDALNSGHEALLNATNATVGRNMISQLHWVALGKMMILHHPWNMSQLI